VINYGVLVSLALAVGSAVVLGLVTQAVATRHDHPRMRAGMGYRKVGILPISHHITEAAYFLFVGWALQIVISFLGIPYWIVFVLAIAFVALMYAQLGSLQKKYNLPDEPKWHAELILVVLVVALLAGFFAPWPNI
jgi:hypothetical protein